jgi:NADPH-dependent glutamate synthase beta subunit-like oxidoreductase
VKTFDEIVVGYTEDEAIQEAARAVALGLGSLPGSCPFGVDIRSMVEQIAKGDFDAALELVLAAHPWPGVVGRQCRKEFNRAPTLGPGADGVNLGALERAAADFGVPPRPRFVPGAPTGRRVAVVGAGSAGSAAAWRLGALGHDVTVLDQLPVPGGMMAVGYPDFRLPSSVVSHENDLASWGVDWNSGVRVDDQRFGELMHEFDATVVATGEFQPIALDIEGEDLAGVWPALDFLTEFKLGGCPVVGEKIVVIGAGYTAQDASRTCRRLGREVSVFYRRGAGEMPLEPSLRKRHIARQVEEGAPYVFYVAPVRIVGQRGQAEAVEFVRCEPGPPDATGRPSVVPVARSNFEVACDTVLVAIGEEADLSYLSPLVGGGGLLVDPSGATPIPGVFAAGTIAGARSTRDAFLSGLQVAGSIDTYLGA